VLVFTDVRKLEYFLHGKDDEEVKWLVGKMGMVGGASGFPGVSSGGTGVSGGRPKVEFNVTESPAQRWGTLYI
jgi:hypothetical protein